jgi:hypothetical protein
MKHRASIRLMFAVIGAAPLALFGAGPATQPVSDTVAAPQVAPAPVVSGNGDDIQGHGHGGPRGGGIPLSNKDFADAVQFMQAHSKERYNFIEGMPDGKLKAHFKELATRDVVQVMRIQKEDPDLYRVSVTRIETEDQVFGLVAQYHKASPDQQDVIKEKLKSKVAELVDIGIKERHLRLNSLQATVDKEKNQLAEDEENKVKLVDERVTAVLNAGGGLGASFQQRTGPNGGANGGLGSHRGEKHQPNDAPAQ